VKIKKKQDDRLKNNVPLLRLKAIGLLKMYEKKILMRQRPIY